MTHRNHPVWTDAADAGTIAEALGITDAAIAAANPTPGTTLVLTCRMLRGLAAVEGRTTAASTDLVEMLGMRDRVTIEDLLLAVRSDCADRGVAELARIPAEMVPPLLRTAIQRWLAADRAIPELVTRTLRAHAGTDPESARLLEAVAAQQESHHRQAERENHREAERAHRVAQVEAQRLAAAAGLPEPGETTLADLAGATDAAFLQLTRVAVTLFPDDTLTGALCRLTGQDRPGLDAAYAAFWSRSRLQRPLAEELLKQGGGWIHELDPALAVAYLSDPVAFACGPHLAELPEHRAIAALLACDKDALHEHLVTSYPDQGDQADGPALCSVAVRHLRAGDADGVAALWWQMDPRWRSVLFHTNRSAEQRTVIEAARVARDALAASAAGTNPQSHD